MGVADDIALLDHHCHSVVRRVDDAAVFDALATEANAPAPQGTSTLDSPVGLAIRRICAPVIGLEPLAPVHAYVDARLAMGDVDATERLLRAARLKQLFVDHGHRPDELLSITELGVAAGAPAREVVRLEQVAEEVANHQPDAALFAQTVETELARRATDAVGFKTIAAYRTGLALDPERPSDRDVVAAAGQFLRRGGGGRLDDPVLIRFLIWTAADIGGQTGRPLQIHTGFGDPDLTLHDADPSRFTPFVRALEPTAVEIVFLHCYPYHRVAGAMAAVFPRVSFDVGLALTYTGPSAPRVLAEAMEVAPFTKQLYSSDGFGLAELFLVGAESFRQSLNSVLDTWLAEGRCHVNDAEHLTSLMASGNARRIYAAA